MTSAILEPVTSDLDKTFRIMPHVASFADLQAAIGKIAAHRLTEDLRKYMMGHGDLMSDAEVFEDVLLWFLRTGELEAFVRLHDENDPWTRIHLGRTDISEGPESVQ